MSLMNRVGGTLRYVVIGIVLVAGIVALAALRPDISSDRFHTWFSFFFFTSILGLVLAKMYWPVRKSPKVWLLLAFFMLMHVVAYTFLLQSVRQWPSLLYLLTGPVEVMLFAAIAKILLDVLPPKVKL
jgi:uncharacterized transporter YbjL